MGKTTTFVTLEDLNNGMQAQSVQIQELTEARANDASQLTQLSEAIQKLTDERQAENELLQRLIQDRIMPLQEANDHYKETITNLQNDIQKINEALTDHASGIKMVGTLGVQIGTNLANLRTEVKSIESIHTPEELNNLTNQNQQEIKDLANNIFTATPPAVLDGLIGVSDVPNSSDL